MPVYLKEIDDWRTLERFASVLIVPCRFCPAASFAVSENRPYFEFLRTFLKTDAYEQYIRRLQGDLEKKGVTVEVFRSHWLHQFVVCMWTARRRRKLMRRARNVDALVVLGCEAAVQTISDSVGASPVVVLQGLKTEGIMSLQPRFHRPCNLSLRLASITPLLHPATTHHSTMER